MKKISAVLLVLVLVGSVAFASFTGSATTGIGYNMDSGEWGFIEQSTSVTVDVTLLENLGEAVGEGDIYASIKATLDFTFSNADEGSLEDTNELLIGANLDFDHAKVFGDNWYVSILSAARAANFATSAIDSEELDRDPNKLNYANEAKDYYADLRSRDIFDRVAGIEVGYADYVLGIGFKGDHIDNDQTDVGEGITDYDETGYQAFVSLQTPDFDLMDGLTAKFGVAGFMQKGPLQSWDDDDDTATTAKADDNALSAHAKVAYEDDMTSVSLGFDAIYDDAELDFDVALAASYDIFSLDAYFATKSWYVHTDDGFTGSPAAPDKLLSAKVAVDLDPLTVTVTGKDLVNDKDLGVEVGYQLSEELLVTVNGGYVIDTKLWSAGADLEYVTDDYTAKLGGSFNGDDVLAMSASVESETLVPGATLKLAWADAKDMLEKDADVATKFGKIVASAEIAF